MRGNHDKTQLLIIDDDLLVRALAVESLQAADFDVREADNGASGLTLVDQYLPDLILLDVTMPGMSGFEVCRTLRSHPQHAHIPVIMLTGLDDTASIETAYESGATDFITKPINSALLIHRIRYALRASRMVVEMERHRASLANAQRIARLGSWTWRAADAHFDCSAEYQQVMGGHTLPPDYQWPDMLKLVHHDDAANLSKAMQAAMQAGEPYAMAYRIICPDGSQRTVYEQTHVSRNDTGGVVRIEGSTQDITERVLAEERIRQLADYDALTGLANRRLFSEAMQRGLHQSTRRNSNAAVFNINIDRFNRINETLGHTAGDQVLKEVARRIIDGVRASDLASQRGDVLQSGLSARMGGDGFAVFLMDVRRAEDAALIARRLIEAISRPMQCGEHELTVTARMGIAVYPDNGDDVSTLLKNAETAMNRAKRDGAGSYSFFTSAMTKRSLTSLQLENDLRSAIERNELVLHYQARVDVATGHLAGAEALVRWQHPQRGLVPPNEFIPMAEESGLIAPMTTWVVRAACRQQQQWQRAGLSIVPVSVNLSAHNFREAGLSEMIQATLREFDISAAYLECEITESMLMQDVERSISRLHALRDIGIELAIDDFGTGYSSLAYLKRFPLNVLKIDRAFVKDVLTDTSDAAIASAIITLGRAMGLTVVAEGMERVEQANYLLSLGCQLMQGYLFARPLPAEAFAALLRDGIELPVGLNAPGVEFNAAIPAPPAVAQKAMYQN